MTLSSGIVYIRPIKVMYLRVEGADRAAAVAAWDQMTSLLQERRILHSVSRGFGLIRGNRRMSPADVPQTYDAAVELTSSVCDLPDLKLRVQTLPGGSYLRARHRNGIETVPQSFSELCDTHLEPRGLELDPRRPLVEIYLARKPGRIEGSSIELCVPVKPTE